MNRAVTKTLKKISGSRERYMAIITMIELIGAVLSIFFNDADDMPPRQEKRPDNVANGPLYDPRTLDDSIAALRSMGMKARDAKDNAKYVLSAMGDIPVEEVVREVLRMSWDKSRK